MITYQKYSVYLTANQEAKLRDAFKHNKGCYIVIIHKIKQIISINCS